MREKRIYWGEEKEKEKWSPCLTGRKNEGEGKEKRREERGEKEKKRNEGERISERKRVREREVGRDGRDDGLVGWLVG